MSVYEEARDKLNRESKAARSDMWEPAAPAPTPAFEILDLGAFL